MTVHHVYSAPARDRNERKSLFSVDLREPDDPETPSQTVTRVLARALLDGQNLNFADFSGAPWSGFAMNHLVDDERRKNLATYFPGADFSHGNLGYANLTGMNLRKTRFVSCDLTGVRFDRADLSGADLRSAKSGADSFRLQTSMVSFQEACLNGANLRGARFRFANMTGADLGGADLTGVRLGRLTLSENLMDADLREIRMSFHEVFRALPYGEAETALERIAMYGRGSDATCFDPVLLAPEIERRVWSQTPIARFTSTAPEDIYGPMLTVGTRRVVRSILCDWAEQALEDGLHCHEAPPDRISFSIDRPSILLNSQNVRAEIERIARAGASFDGVQLFGMDLRGADLRGLSFRGADLRGADLRGADLTGADFEEADFRYADLTGASLTGTRLFGARMPMTIGDSVALEPLKQAWMTAMAKYQPDRRIDQIQLYGAARAPGAGPLEVFLSSLAHQDWGVDGRGVVRLLSEWRREALGGDLLAPAEIEDLFHTLTKFDPDGSEVIPETQFSLDF